MFIQDSASRIMSSGHPPGLVYLAVDEPEGDLAQGETDNDSPKTDLHVRSYAERHVRAYADRNDPRGHPGDRGRHEPRQDRGDYHRAPSGVLPVDSGAAQLHRKEGNEQEAPAGIADVVGQAASRSGPPDPRGVLRAAVLRPLSR